MANKPAYSKSSSGKPQAAAGDTRPAGAIPLRSFGSRDDVKVSALAMGGHHLGDAKDEQTAIRSCKRLSTAASRSSITAGNITAARAKTGWARALKGRRDNVFLMTKVCTHGRDGSLALQMLEESLNRLQTDHLDLWQIHGVAFDNDPELFIRTGRSGGSAAQAKQQGKVRFVGFTGHKDPAIHLKMLETGFPFDAVQMPLNAF